MVRPSSTMSARMWIPTRTPATISIVEKAVEMALRRGGVPAALLLSPCISGLERAPARTTIQTDFAAPACHGVSPAHPARRRRTQEDIVPESIIASPGVTSTAAPRRTAWLATLAACAALLAGCADFR